MTFVLVLGRVTDSPQLALAPAKSLKVRARATPHPAPPRAPQEGSVVEAGRREPVVSPADDVAPVSAAVAPTEQEAGVAS